MNYFDRRNMYNNFNYIPNYYPLNLDQYYRNDMVDHGPNPYVVNIDKVSKQNNNYRTTLWTGNHMQLTVMSINVGDDIGLEVHPTNDQFIRIEEGEGLVQMGNTANNLTIQEKVNQDYAVLVPAGTWHNVVNTGTRPLKVYSLYAPPKHPKGTVNQTKVDVKRTIYY